MPKTSQPEPIKTEMGQKIIDQKLAARCFYILSQCIPLVGKEKDLFQIAEMSQEEYENAVDIFGENATKENITDLQREFLKVMANGRKNQILGLIRLIDLMYKENSAGAKWASEHGIKIGT